MKNKDKEVCFPIPNGGISPAGRMLRACLWDISLCLLRLLGLVSSTESRPLWYVAFLVDSVFFWPHKKWGLWSGLWLLF